MDDSRFNAYGTHCLSDIIMDVASPMGEEELNSIVYLLKQTKADGQTGYITTTVDLGQQRLDLVITFIDSEDAERFKNEKYPDCEVEEIVGSKLTKQLGSNGQGAQFHYVENGEPNTLDVWPKYFELYEDHHQQGRPRMSYSEYLATLPRVKNFPIRFDVGRIERTFKKLKIPNAALTFAVIELMSGPEYVVDYFRAGGFKKAEIDKVDRAAKLLKATLKLPKGLYVNIENDPTELETEIAATPNAPFAATDTAEQERKRKERKERRERGKSKGRNGEAQAKDDGFVCAEIDRKIRSKKNTMEHPFVQQLAKAFSARKNEPFASEVLDDEQFELYLHFDTSQRFQVTKTGIDIFVDEAMWKRAFDESKHDPYPARKTIRQLLEFSEENKADVRLFFPDREGLDFIVVPYAQLHEFYELMPKQISTNIEELRALPRVSTPEAQQLAKDSADLIQGIPGTNTIAYVAEDQGRLVLVVEVEESKPLTEVSENQLFARSFELERRLPDDVNYRFKIVTPLQPDSDPKVIPSAGR